MVQVLEVCLFVCAVFLLSSPTASEPSGPQSADCIASWYGADGEIPAGWPTASEEPFDRNAMATAALQWGFGTMLRVTNTANGKSVDVRVNDRGPYVARRCVDLTRGAFTHIADLDTGIVNVHVQRLN